MTVTGTGGLPVLAWLEVRGFRAFGTEPRRLDLDAPLSVVHGGNSVGKSSLAEALEFLLTGRSSRRDLLGGAKAEYHESLRNAHLPAGDQDVWVAAGVRGSDGQVHEVRRELVCDFAQGTECTSRLVVGGVEQSDLAAFGLAPAEGSALGAPVLLQHTLRHVLSTQPKDRVAYFKSLLSLTDLDAFRERVTQARRRFAAQPPTPAGRAFAALAGTPFSDVAQLLRLALPEDDGAAAQLVHEALLTAGTQALGQRPDDLESLITGLQAAVDQQREAVFPLAAFTASQPPGDPAPVNVSDYAAALAEADREAATLALIFSAVLAVPALSEISRPVDCPVCATPSALTPERMAALRDELRRGAAVQKAAQDAARELRVVVDVATRAGSDAAAAVPAASTWTPQQVQLARQQMAALGLEEAILLAAGAAARRVGSAASSVQEAAQVLEATLRADLQDVERRADLDDQGRNAALRSLGEALAGLRLVRQDSDAAAAALRAAVEPVVSTRTAKAGLVELLVAARHADTLVPELRRAAARDRADTRLADAEKALAAAAATVLDSRFEQMSGSIARWWLTIRPEELVAFAGVQRRAAGTTFVNLMASLRTDSTAEPVERHALGIFSDSQLNALGLSTFLARTEVLRTPLVVLDDPIPGSDGDHRLAFVQNTLEGLLESGTQVVLTTYDDKLAEWAAAQHVGRDCRTFELMLGDQVAGTEATQTSDVFDQLMLEANDSLNAPTAKGRRAACNTYRSAAERLAKQIIATGRTAAGVPTTLGDVEREAKILGDLAPLVKGFALNNTEKGYWGTFAKVLNPGSHDDQVPSTAELKQVRGNLRKLNKDHKAHWPDGLVR
ncbi:MAG: AAA family ATPase [Mycobacteriales bacterium]